MVGFWEILLGRRRQGTEGATVDRHGLKGAQPGSELEGPAPAAVFHGERTAVTSPSSLSGSTFNSLAELLRFSTHHFLKKTVVPFSAFLNATLWEKTAAGVGVFVGSVG